MARRPLHEGLPRTIHLVLLFVLTLVRYKNWGWRGREIKEQKQDNGLYSPESMRRKLRAAVHCLIQNCFSRTVLKRPKFPVGTIDVSRTMAPGENGRLSPEDPSSQWELRNFRSINKSYFSGNFSKISRTRWVARSRLERIKEYSELSWIFV